MAINELNYQNIALAISAYAQERWTAERRINSTGIVTTNADITPNGENYFGQLRWYKPLDAVYNQPSTTVDTAGLYTDLSTEIANYIKSARAMGMKQVNIAQAISKQDGLAWFANQYAQGRAQDEHNAVLSVLEGVAAAEVAVGEGIESFEDFAGATRGAFIDINADGAFGAAAVGSADARKLVDASEVGAARGERLFRAMGMFWKDYEPDFVYLITPPEQMAEFRAANLVDDTTITDGNLEFQTLFGGKFRILLTRANQGNLAASANVNDQSTKTSFIVKPGAVIFQDMTVPVPVEIDRVANAYRGGGTTEMWYRYGFIAHPLGYDWVGATNDFASNAALASAASWDRKVDPLNLGILPVLHA